MACLPFLAAIGPVRIASYMQSLSCKTVLDPARYSLRERQEIRKMATCKYTVSSEACWVALVLILVGLCVGTQAEEISLTAENYTLKFDPGYPASFAQYATVNSVVDRVGFTRSSVDFGADRIFAVIDIYEKPRFPTSILNSFAIMARFDTFLGMLGANEHNMFLYNPLVIG
jgi:hypothetical protein